jgi:tyrosine-protein kinase Etk/Wzc
MEHNTGILYLLKLLFLKRKPLSIVAVLSAIAGVALAYSIPVYYKSEAVFYPLSPQSYDPRFLFSAGGINFFGSGEDADRIITIGNSSKISEYVIKKYDLRERYDIDSTDPLSSINTEKKFYKNYKISEDDRSAISVTVYDKNPDTAAIIANDIVKQIDSLNRLPLIEGSVAQLEKFKSDLEKRYAAIDSLHKMSLDKYKTVNEAQKEMVAYGLIHTYSELKQAETRLAILKENFNTLHIVQEARPNVKKARPVRWMVAAGTFFGSLVIFFILLVVFDQYNNVLKKQL